VAIIATVASDLQQTCMNVEGYAYLASYSRFPIPNPYRGADKSLADQEGNKLQ